MNEDRFTFGRFRVDVRRREVWRDDKSSVRLGSRALDILCMLVAAKGSLVTKDELMARVWPGVVVEENNLQVHVSALRKVLDEEGSGQCSLVTVPGRGYRLIGVQAVLSAGPGPSVRLQSLPPVVAPHLSIVVLPFTNLSDDREQQYLADGITQDLTTDLSRIVGMFVISRNTAFTYRNKPIDTKQIGRELGVRYVLEGSVRLSGKQVRINAELIDVDTNAHLWAERFDRDKDDLFALQNEITSRIAVTLELELVGAEAARRAEHPDALYYVLRGRETLYTPQSRGKYAESIGLFESALTLDPQSVEAQSWLANALAARVLDQVTDSAEADIAYAERLVAQALAASPRRPLPHFAKGQVLRAQHRYKEAIPEFETTLALNRNWTSALAALGWCKLFSGSIEETIGLEEQAIRLSPRDPYNYNRYGAIGLVHLLQSHNDEAIIWFEKVRSANSELPAVHAWLASAYSLNGETERAANELAEARRLSRDNRYWSIGALKPTLYLEVPKIRALFEATYFAGLRKAGMPEE